MKLFRIAIWIGFLAILSLNIYYTRTFSHAGERPLPVIEFAGSDSGPSIISGWQSKDILSTAVNLTWLDFAFIFCYVSIIIVLSNRRVRREPSIELNAVLRANFFFAVVAGLLDVLENVGLLYDMRQHDFISTYWVALTKFILAGWTVLVWLVSLAISRFRS